MFFLVQAPLPAIGSVLDGRYDVGCQAWTVATCLEDFFKKSGHMSVDR